MKLVVDGVESNYPDFLIVGAGKCGTSSLHEYLKQHPEICLPKNKELNFWHLNRNPNKAIDNYVGDRILPRTLPEYLRHFSHATEVQYVGEVCPSYLYFNEYTIESLRKLHPAWRQVKIIIILRDPVDRILSQYRYVRQRKLDPENLPLALALESEDERKNNNNLLPDLHYVSASLYYEQVKAYIDNFAEVYICFYEDLEAQTERLLFEILGFIGVADANLSYIIDVKKYNVSKPLTVPRFRMSGILFEFIKSVEKRLPDFKLNPGLRDLVLRILNKDENISEELVENLRVRLLPDIELLEHLLQVDLEHWKPYSQQIDTTRNSPRSTKKLKSVHVACNQVNF